MYKILITDDLGTAGMAMLAAAPDVQADVVKLPSREKLASILGNYDAIITRSGTPLDAQTLRSATSLKIAARAGVGVDNIDVDAASLQGILVMNTPEANTLAATEMTMTLLLSLCRRLPLANASLRRGEWTRGKFTGVELNGKVLGVVGLGRIGSRVATRCQAFGMRVIAYDPYISEEIAGQLRVGLVGTLDELLQEADVVTVHTPLTDETRGMIGAAQIEQMKQGARLVNCARGGIIDEEALYAALISGRLAGAALDVYTSEPPGPDLVQRLLALENVVASPHIGANTLESQNEVAVQIVAQLLEALRGEGYRNVVNLPFAQGVEYHALRPYLDLAERIGALQMQLIHGRIGRVEVEFRGEEVEGFVKPLTVALLKGLLSPILGDSVNYVNAPHLADQRGITVSQARHPTCEDYSNLILCRVVSTKETRIIGGALFLRSQPRIVLLDDQRLDALPVGRALILTNRDVPGVVGQVGTLLGSMGINIAEWRMGRSSPGGSALSFINIDTPASPEALERLRALPTIIDVRQVNL